MCGGEAGYGPRRHKQRDLELIRTKGEDSSLAGGAPLLPGDVGQASFLVSGRVAVPLTYKWRGYMEEFSSGYTEFEVPVAHSGKSTRGGWVSKSSRECTVPAGAQPRPQGGELRVTEARHILRSLTSPRCAPWASLRSMRSYFRHVSIKPAPLTPPPHGGSAA